MSSSTKSNENQNLNQTENQTENQTPHQTPNQNQSNQSSKKKTKPVKRCQFSGCKKKLTLTQKSIACKCKMYFCAKHRYAEDHSCTFDFKSADKKILKTSLLNCKIVNSCMEKL